MIDAKQLLAAIERKVKPWNVSSSFEDVQEAKQYAAKLFVHTTAVRVAPFAGGVFSVLSYTKSEDKGEII